jgi:membrane-associated phospholipid phosphatase
MTPWMEWGIALIVQLQAWGEWLISPMRLLTFLGDEQFYLLFMPGIVWCVNTGLGFRIGIILLTSAGINDVLKLSFGLPRPYWVSREVAAHSTASSFGLPSGHAQTAVAVWGRLVVWITLNWIRVLLTLLILLISISRWFLGVHFPMDTFTGWGIGILLLLVVIKLEAPLRARMIGWSLGRQILLGFLASFALVLLGWLALNFLAPVSIPDAWVETARAADPSADMIDPLSFESVVSVAGTLLGVAVGGAMLFKWGGFRAEGSWQMRLGRYLFGLAGMILIFYGLRLIFPAGDTPLAMSLRYLRYAAAGFWAMYLGPRVFVRVRLA